MAVDPNIKKKADDIRNKVYGREVRESLASGLEEMSSDVVENEGRQSVVEGRQDSVESQWQAVSDEMTDKDVISAPEIIAARDGEANLKARLDKEKNEVAAQLTQTVETVPMPAKNGAVTNSPKLVIVDKKSTNQIKVVQYNGKDYIIYSLDDAPGDSSHNSVGQSWSLIRIKKAVRASAAYVAKKDYNPSHTKGVIDTLYAPDYRNTFENYMVSSNGDEENSSFLSSSGNGFGLATHGLSDTSGNASEVSWDVKIGASNKCNIVVFGTTTSSESADILVNDEVVKSFNPTKLALGSNLTFKIIEFELPSRVNFSAPVKVTLRNNDVTGKKLYFVALNFMSLKNYDGRDIDFYKTFTTSNKWINHGGSSDYAIFDKDLQKWCGSYHGGETRISARMLFYSRTAWEPTSDWYYGKYNLQNITNVPDGWYVLPSFKIQQVTNVNGKGKMYSLFNFDSDGTMDMSFSFYDGDITVESFYTALVTTHVTFEDLRYPKYEQLPSSGNIDLKMDVGHVIQTNLSKGLSLGSRFTMFGQAFNKEPWIYSHASYYKKLYYGFVDNYEAGVYVDNLQFSKSLDFMSE